MQLVKLNRNIKWKRLLAAALALTLTAALSAALAEGERAMAAVKRGARTFEREGTAEARPDASRRQEGAKLPGPAADDSEQSLRRLLSDASGWERFEYFYRADYDGDGSAEAFALAGTFDGSAYAGELWFVRPDRAQRLQQGLRYAALEIASAAPGLAFRAVECDDGAVHTWTVQDGAPRRADAAIPEPTAAPEAVEAEGEGSEPEVAPEAVESESEGSEPEATPEAVEPESEGSEPEATPEAVESEGEGSEPEVAPEAAEPEGKGSEPEVAPEAVEPEGEGIAPAIVPEPALEAADAEDGAPDIRAGEGDAGWYCRGGGRCGQMYCGEGSGCNSDCAPLSGGMHCERAHAASEQVQDSQPEGPQAEVPQIEVPPAEVPQEEIPQAEPASASDAEATDSYATDGQAADGYATDGQAVDGQATDGRAADGQVTDGYATGDYAAYGYASGTYSGEAYTGSHAYGGYPADGGMADGYATGDYAAGGYASGAYPGEAYNNEYAYGDYPADGHAADGYAAGNPLADGRAVDGYASGGYASGAYSGEPYSDSYAYGNYSADGYADGAYYEGDSSDAPGAGTLRVAEDAQLRTGPGAGFGVLSELPAGTEVESLGEQAQDETGAVWCYLRSGERAGWCPAECLESGEAAAGYAYAADEANLRSGPGLESGVIARIPGGAAVEYLGESVADGLGATWHYVRYRNWQGWCASVVVSAAP